MARRVIICCPYCRGNEIVSRELAPVDYPVAFWAFDGLTAKVYEYGEDRDLWDDDTIAQEREYGCKHCYATFTRPRIELNGELFDPGDLTWTGEHTLTWYPEFAPEGWLVHPSRLLAPRCEPHRLELDLPEWREDWHDEDKDEPGRMTRPVYMNGVLHHLEAIELHVDPKDDCQKAVNPYWEDTLCDYSFAVNPDAPFATMSIRGREWAIFMSPGCM